jgi:hypothetical protein
VEKQRPLTQSDVVIQCWEDLQTDAIGAHELEIISASLAEHFGEGALSPAAIARVLADHGESLRHSDVLDADTKWRAGQLFPVLPKKFETIDDAIIFVRNLRAFSLLLDEPRMRRFRTAVLSIQRELQLIANSHVVSNNVRNVAGEAAAWLKIWLQSPALFEDWLALRRESPEFRKKFSQ